MDRSRSPVAPKIASFSRPFPKVDFWMHLGRPLAHFWHPSGSNWLSFGSLWLPFRSLWPPFGTLFAPCWFLLGPSGVILTAVGHILSPFRFRWRHLAPKCDFGHLFFAKHLQITAICSHNFCFVSNPNRLEPDFCKNQLLATNFGKHLNRIAETPIE